MVNAICHISHSLAHGCCKQGSRGLKHFHLKTVHILTPPRFQLCTKYVGKHILLNPVACINTHSLQLPAEFGTGQVIITHVWCEMKQNAILNGLKFKLSWESMFLYSLSLANIGFLSFVTPHRISLAPSTECLQTTLAYVTHVH